MKKKELTNASLSALFPDHFQLAQYLINKAREEISGGNEELSLTMLLEETKKRPPEFEELKELSFANE